MRYETAAQVPVSLKEMLTVIMISGPQKADMEPVSYWGTKLLVTTAQNLVARVLCTPVIIIVIIIDNLIINISNIIKHAYNNSFTP